MNEETNSSSRASLPEVSSELHSLTYEEILQFVGSVKNEISSLRSENDLLGHFVSEIEDTSGPIDIGRDRTARPLSPPADMKPELTSDVISLKSSRGGRIAKYPTLSTPHKCYIAKKRLEDLKAELKSLKRATDVATDERRAKFEEIDLEIREQEDEVKYFVEAIKIGAKHHVTKKVMAEKVEKYFNDALKKTVYYAILSAIAIERIKMQISENRTKRKRIIEKMNEKIETEKLLQDVDIEKAKLENEESIALLSRYENQYHDFRAKTNRLLQDIDEKKKTLRKEKAELDHLLEAVSLKERSQEVFELEKNVILKEKEECNALKEKILSNPRCKGMPEVMVYVRLQAALEEKRNQVKSWKAKVEAIEMAQFVGKSKRK